MSDKFKEALDRMFQECFYDGAGKDYHIVKCALQAAQRVEERDAEKSPEEWASEFSALFCDGPLKYMIENEKCAEPHLEVPDDVARPLVEHIVRMQRTFSRRGDEFNPDWMCKGECPAQEALKDHLYIRAKDAQRVENMKAAADVMAKNFNHLIATCDTWTREALSKNVMTTVLQNQLKVCKEALRRYEQAEGEK